MLARVDRPVRVLITGSRNWDCRNLAGTVLRRIRGRYGGRNITIVVGDCPAGVDRAFREACRLMRLKVERHDADWGRFGKAAGPRRNQAMIDSGADFCIACSEDLSRSRGTTDCIKRALAAGIPVWLYEREGGEPRRIREGDLPAATRSD